MVKRKGFYRAKEESTAEEREAKRERIEKEMQEFLNADNVDIEALKKKSKTRALTAKEKRILASEELIERDKAADRYAAQEEEMMEKASQEEKRRLVSGRSPEASERGHKQGFKPPKVERETIRDKESLSKETKRAIKRREIMEEIDQEASEGRRKAA